MVLNLDYINCTRCVVQGEVSSHVLFSLFITELALNGIHRINLSSNFVPLVILVFADDSISNYYWFADSDLTVYLVLLQFILFYSKKKKSPH